MNEYFIEKFFNFAKSLRLLRPSSIPWIVLTGILAGILTFHLQITLRDFFISLSPQKVPIFGQVLGREYDLFPIFTSALLGFVIWFFLFWTTRSFVDFLLNLYLAWLSGRQKKLEIDFTKIDSIKFAHSWEIQGSPILRKDGLAFTNSNSGCLIKKELLWWILPSNLKMWKNFQAEIVVNFVQESHIVNDLVEGVWKSKIEEFRKVLGIVFRAQNLEDYFMLEIWRIDNTLSFRPHVRLSGNWDAPYFNAPQKYTLKKSGPLTFNLEATDNIVTVKIKGDEIFKWTLPKLFEANLIQHREKSADIGAVVKIPFSGKAGRFGFRNYGNELALVKKLVIEPLKKASDSI